MKKHLITGLVILLPIALTLLVLVFLMDLLTAPFLGIVHGVLTFLGSNILYLQNHQIILLFLSRVIVLLLLFVLILVLGYLGNKIFFNWLLQKFHRIMLAIPFIKKIYKSIRDLIKTFFSEKGSIFESSVVVNFPFEHTYMMGFQSESVPSKVIDKVPELKNGKTVFVPTAIHPTSGFLVMMKEDKIHPTEMTTEEVLKFLISAGLFVPKDKHVTDDKAPN
jgi:uncharacterized membrane protein